VIVIMIAGWIERADPAFTIVPGTARNFIYIVRLLTGIAMFAGSVEWFTASLALTNKLSAAMIEVPGAKVA
jgi:cytochrome c oxidase cbb3-type subunit I